MRRVGLHLVALIIIATVVLSRPWGSLVAAGTGNLYIRFLDEHGMPAPIYLYLYRDGFAGIVRNQQTDPNGWVYWTGLEAAKYRLVAKHGDSGEAEDWGYRNVYVYEGKTQPYYLRRETPYVSALTIEPAVVAPGQPVTVTVGIRDNYSSSFNEQSTLLALHIDRGQTLPGEYVFNGGPWPSHGPITATFTVVPSQAGLYYVRPRVLVRYQEQEPYLTDEGWWRWSFRVDEPTPTPTPTFTATATTTATPTPTATASPTWTATPTLTATATPSPTATEAPTLTATPTPLGIYLPFVVKQIPESWYQTPRR